MKNLRPWTIKVGDSEVTFWLYEDENNNTKTITNEQYEDIKKNN